MNRDLEGRLFLITGANTGVGRASAENIAARGGALILAGRSLERTQPVLDAIRKLPQAPEVSFVAVDLGSLASVRRAADEILKRDVHIDVLLNNAGLAAQPGLTEDGFEKTFGTNHLGPFLFTEKLLPLLGKDRASRIVNVSSRAHYDAKRIDWEALKKTTQTRTALQEYAVSKLANVLHAKELAARLEGKPITTYALHPGVVATDVWRSLPGPIAAFVKLFMLSVEDGAKTQLHCATSDEARTETGLYYDKSKPKTPSRLARDAALATELRERSLAWVKPFLG
jgi:NAD(P)-dependent dehydrogenase (short-subunit alcohol dehydrogenase family)